MAIWRIEALQSSESTGGETVRLQRATEIPTMQRDRKRSTLQRHGNPEEEAVTLRIGAGLVQCCQTECQRQTPTRAADVHGALSPAGGMLSGPKGLWRVFTMKSSSGRNSMESSETGCTPSSCYPLCWVRTEGGSKAGPRKKIGLRGRSI